MAMTSTLSKPLPAIVNQACNFVLAVINGGGSQVSVYSIQPVVTQANGQLATCCTIGPVIASPELASANTGANQFNVPVAGSSTIYFSFTVTFFGPSVSGGPTQPNMLFVVDAQCSYSDATSSGTLSPMLVAVNQPQFGQAPGSPPNAAPVVGQLNFQVPANGALAF